jgi:hypothetical protein
MTKNITEIMTVVWRNSGARNDSDLSTVAELAKTIAPSLHHICAGHSLPEFSCAKSVSKQYHICLIECILYKLSYGVA